MPKNRFFGSRTILVRYVAIPCEILSYFRLQTLRHQLSLGLPLSSKFFMSSLTSFAVNWICLSRYLSSFAVDCYPLRYKMMFLAILTVREHFENVLVLPCLTTQQPPACLSCQTFGPKPENFRHPCTAHLLSCLCRFLFS